MLGLKFALVGLILMLASVMLAKLLGTNSDEYGHFVIGLIIIAGGVCVVGGLIAAVFML